MTQTLSKGAIAGIAVGGAVILVCLAVLLCLFKSGKRAAGPVSPPAPYGTYETAEILGSIRSDCHVGPAIQPAPVLDVAFLQQTNAIVSGSPTSSLVPTIALSQPQLAASEPSSSSEVAPKTNSSRSRPKAIVVPYSLSRFVPGIPPEGTTPIERLPLGSVSVQSGSSEPGSSLRLGPNRHIGSDAEEAPEQGLPLTPVTPPPAYR